MSLVKNFANLDDSCVWVDWKAGMEEALYALKEHYGNTHLFLHEDKFDALVENYAGESSDEQMLALGQQCTAFGMALYNFDRNSDEYGLLLMPQEDRAALEAFANNNGYKCEQLKQPRKRFGSFAKKIKTSEQLVEAKYKLPDHSAICFAGCFAANQIRHYNPLGEFSHQTSVCYNLALWPPKKQAAKHIINYVAYSDVYQIWAAVFGDQETETVLKISTAPFDKKSWQTIPFSEKPDLAKWEADPAYKHYQGDVLDPLTRLMWVGPDLLLAYTRRHKPGSFASVTHVWVVPDAARGGSACRKVKVTPPCHLTRGEFPHLVTTDRDTYLLLSGRFYTWHDGELRDTGIEALTHTDFSAVATGPHSFAYVAEGRLVEVDMRRSCSRFRDLCYLDHKTTVRKLNTEWAVLLRHGYVDNNLDVAQFWHLKDEKWLRLKLGAFGREGIKNLLQLDDGTLVAQTQAEFCKVDGLWDYLTSLEDAVLEMPPWNENWSKENLEADAAPKVRDAEKNGAFWAKFKALFGRNK